MSLIFERKRAKVQEKRTEKKVIFVRQIIESMFEIRYQTSTSEIDYVRLIQQIKNL